MAQNFLFLVAGALMSVSLGLGLEYIGLRKPNELIAATCLALGLHISGLGCYKSISAAALLYVVMAEVSMSLDHKFIETLKTSVRIRDMKIELMDRETPCSKQQQE